MKFVVAARQKWEGLYEPISPYPIGVFRILFGLCVCATLFLLHGDWLAWFGTHGWITMETIEKAESGLRLNVFAVIPQDDEWISATYWLFFTAAVTLTLGLATKLSSVVVFLAMNSINQRMPLILHGGDTFLRAASFFLCFAASGAVLSLDAVLRRGRARQMPSTLTTIPAWPQRLIQFQLAVVYFASFWWKIQGSSWRNGTALYYVFHLREIQQFPVPRFLREPWSLHLGTWLTLIFELAFPTLVWFKPLRRWVLLAGVTFHLCLEYALNIPMFQWDMLSAYVLFLDPVRLRQLVGASPQAVGSTRERWKRRFAHQSKQREGQTA